MDKKEVSKRLKTISEELDKVIELLNEPEGVHFLTPEIEKDVARKKTENLCFYCSETLEGYSNKEVVRHVHRKCFRPNCLLSIMKDLQNKHLYFHVAYPC